MSVTAQEFRDAAARLLEAGYAENARLLLAAAEQAEQLDKLLDWRAKVTVALHREGGAFFDDVPTHIYEMRDQIATLNAKAAEQAEQLAVCQEANAKLHSGIITMAGPKMPPIDPSIDREVELREQVATLTAERDTITRDARAEVLRLTAELHEALSGAAHAWKRVQQADQDAQNADNRSSMLIKQRDSALARVAELEAASQ